MSSSSQQRRKRVPRPMPVIDLAQLLGNDFRERRIASASRPNQAAEPEPDDQPNREEENVARMPEVNRGDDVSERVHNYAGGDLKRDALPLSVSETANESEETSKRPYQLGMYDSSSLAYGNRAGRRTNNDAGGVKRDTLHRSVSETPNEASETLKRPFQMGMYDSSSSAAYGNRAGQRTNNNTGTLKRDTLHRSVSETPNESETLKHDKSLKRSFQLGTYDSSSLLGNRTVQGETVTTLVSNPKKRPASTGMEAKTTTSTSSSKKQKLPIQPHIVTTPSDIPPSSLNRSVPMTMASSINSSALGDSDNTSAPPLKELANFPQHCGKHKGLDDTKCCVMCGLSRMCYNTRKMGQETGLPFIYKNSTGVCTSCEASVWVVSETGLQVRFCKQCNHFCPLSRFVDNRPNKNIGLRSSCSRCLDHIVASKKARVAEKSPASTEPSINAPNAKRQKESVNSKGTVPDTRYQATITASEIAQSSLNRCVPMTMASPVVSDACSDAVNESVYYSMHVANFPQHYGMPKGTDGAKCSIMCGLSRTCYNTRKMGQETGLPFICKLSKGVCTECESAVWKFTENDIQIRFCKQCRHFRPLAAFVDDLGLRGSCSRCLNRNAVSKKERRELEQAVAEKTRQEKGSNVARKQKAKSNDPLEHVNKNTESLKPAASRIVSVTPHKSKPPKGVHDGPAVEGTSKKRKATPSKPKEAKTREIPASSDSSEDDMTLREMMALINRHS